MSQRHPYKNFRFLISILLYYILIKLSSTFQGFYEGKFERIAAVAKYATAQT